MPVGLLAFTWMTLRGFRSCEAVPVIIVNEEEAAMLHEMDFDLKENQALVLLVCNT